MEVAASVQHLSSTLSDCQVCEPYRSDPQLLHYWRPDWACLSRAVNSGCPICEVVYSAASTFLDDKTTPDLMAVHTGEKRKGIFLNLCCSDRVIHLELHSIREVHPAFPRVNPARVICDSGDSENCFKLAKSWLESCLSTHTKCAHTSNNTLPTRLVDVGSETVDPHLHIPKLGEHADYVALSHCWGTEKPPLRTNVSNLSAMCRCIPLSDLPLNFKDAITVTRAMGLRFLWIDSLCILQDSSDDWDSESANMGHIYSNALFVLAAAAGESCNSGFLVGGQRDGGVLINLTRQSIEQENCPLLVRRRYNILDSYGGHNRLTYDRTKLSTRGWAFQEQILARRILSYSSEEMSWECLETSLCECKPTPNLSNSIQTKLQLSCGLKHRSDFHQIWTDLVQEYTSRWLTLTSDRLPAISGIGERLQSPMAGQYLAGLWSNYLLHGLAWRTGHRSEGKSLILGSEYWRFSSKRQENNYAPSWSWASITGPISFWSVTANGEPYWDVSVQEILFQVDGANKYGSPDQASLQITGRLVKVSIDNPSPKDNVDLSFGVALAGTASVQGGLIEHRASADVWDIEYYQFDEPYYLLPLFHYDNDKQFLDIFSYRGTMSALALVLKRASKKSNSYERVGYVFLAKEEYAHIIKVTEETNFTFV